MKARRRPPLLGVIGVFLYVSVVLVTGQRGDNSVYVATDLDDPLQSVWDALDRISGEVSAAVVEAIRSQITARNSQLDSKLRPLTTTLSSMASTLNRLEDRLMQSDYVHLPRLLLPQRSVTNLDELVTKIERHVDTQRQELEASLKAYIDSKLLPSQPSPSSSDGDPSSLMQTLRNNTATLQNINTHVLKINEKIGGSGGSGDSCRTIVDRESQSSLPLGLPRDCSDKHWMQPEAQSGVYEIFPTLDPKAPVNSYCDMGQAESKDTGGWTVILRRRNSTFGLVNFNRTWSEYRIGFGDPGEGEWWLGLSSLHALTYRQPFEVDLLIRDIQRGYYHAQYTTFRVEDESRDYKLNLNGFTGNLTHDALVNKHHGSPFSTWDRDNDAWGSGNCGQSNGGGWWFNNCHFTTLTAPFPTSNDRNARTIRWLDDDWLVLDDVTMKIRPFNYAQRFNAHTTP